MDRSDTYNLCIGGCGGSIRKGRKASDEQRRKMSEAWKAKYRQGYKPHMLGKNHSPSTKSKISKSHMGKTPWNKGKVDCYSEDVTKRMSQTRIKNGRSRGENNPMFGVHRFGSDNPNFGHKWTPEQKEAASKRMKAIRAKKRGNGK